MKKLSLLVLVSLFSSVLLAQKIEMSETELKTKLDSVLVEGNLLYRYEKSAWISTDLARENPVLKEGFNRYFTYEDQGQIKVIFFSDNFQSCTAEYVFENNFDKPKSVKIEKRELSEKEKTLFEVRNKILEDIGENKYDITIPQGYGPNLILLPFGEKYKLYIIMGTSQDNVIPFGNDYLFIANKDGKIESWEKFHSRLIPGYTRNEGKEVVEIMHSHLRTTPLITATDICTFMLYAPSYKMDKFSIYSPAIEKSMEYSLKNNEITVSSEIIP